MTVSRRSFLIGVGSIITASFVKDAVAYAADTRHPLLLTPEAPTQIMYYQPVENYWHLSLGEPRFEAPEPEFLIENCRFHGHVLDTQQQIDAYCDDTGWTEKDLFSPMNGWDWETQWEHNLNPAAKAFQFLSENDVFPVHGKGRREGRVVFQDSPHPMSSYRWVEVHDPLSISLLQARLNELDLGVTLRHYG